jgi:hypothetical protein
MSEDCDWEAAYEELLRECLRLQHKYERLKRDYEHARAAIENDLVIADLQLPPKPDPLAF